MIGNPYLAKRSLILFSLFFIFAFILLYIVPYTRDDWAWGSSIGIDRLTDFFRDYNGRYAGNITEIILTRFRWLRALVQTAVMCGIVYYMAPKYKNINFFYMLGICVLLLAPISMLRQTIVYTAGFSNYVIPTLFMIGFIRYFEPLLYAQKKEELNFNPHHSVFICIISFGSCIFMEHITLYLLFLSGVVIIYSFIKYRKIFVVEISFMVGCLAGSLMMFSNGAYWKVLDGSDKYRSLGSPNNQSAADYYIRELGSSLYVQNWFVNILICLTLFLLVRKFMKARRNKAFFASSVVLGCILLIMTTGATIIFILDKFLGYGDFNAIFSGIPMAVVYLIILTGCLVCLMLLLRKQSGKLLPFLFISIILVNLPLIIVNPVSPRCFFPAFILTCIFIMECLRYIDIGKWWIRGTAVLTIISFIFLFIIYIPMFKADNARLADIREQVAEGKTEIVIKELPNKYFIWASTPKTGTKWEKRYKLYYGIPKEVTLVTQ